MEKYLPILLLEQLFIGEETTLNVWASQHKEPQFLVFESFSVHVITWKWLDWKLFVQRQALFAFGLNFSLAMPPI